MNEPQSKLEASRNRARIAAAGLGVLSAILGLTINNMLPLKEKVPYVVYVNNNTGEVSISENAVVKFSPSDANKAFFIRQFLENLMTLDAARTKEHLLPKAAAVLRGPAVAQYKSWLDSDKPIERLIENPLLSRHIKNINVNFVQGADVAIIRFNLVTATGETETTQAKSASVKFALVERDISETNPLGFYVIDFNFKDEF